MSASSEPRLVHYHAPRTRSSTIRWLIAELGAPHDLVVIDMAKGEQRAPAYLAVNPMGKVPAIKHGDTVVTESGAICTYLADAYPAAGLAPPIGDPARGTYLRWMFFYGSAFEPAIVDKALKREPGTAAMMPYGDFDTTIASLAAALKRGPWLLGERFSAADVLLGSGVRWTTLFGLLPDRPEFKAYAQRLSERPALIRATQADEELHARLTAGSKPS